MRSASILSCLLLGVMMFGCAANRVVSPFTSSDRTGPIAKFTWIKGVNHDHSDGTGKRPSDFWEVASSGAEVLLGDGVNGVLMWVSLRGGETSLFTETGSTLPGVPTLEDALAGRRIVSSDKRKSPLRLWGGIETEFSVAAGLQSGKFDAVFEGDCETASVMRANPSTIEAWLHSPPNMQRLQAAAMEAADSAIRTRLRELSDGEAMTNYNGIYDAFHVSFTVRPARAVGSKPLEGVELVEVTGKVAAVVHVVIPFRTPDE